LLFVFLAMLMALALVEQAPAEIAPGKGEPVVRRALVVSQIQQALQADGVEVYVDLEDGVLRLPERMLFETGSAGLRPEGHKSVEALAKHLQQFVPGLVGLESVVIEGHTDNRPVRAPLTDGQDRARDNWDLSFLRAKRTYEGILAAAPDLKRLENRRHDALFCVGAFGPTRPVGDNDLEQGRALNRRIDVRLVIQADEAAPPRWRPHG
jgi:flagellar motor protein MotB